MRKPPPGKPTIRKPATTEEKPDQSPVTPERKEFVPKVIIMLPMQKAQELATQINTLRKEHPDLLNGPLGELLNLIK